MTADTASTAVAIHATTTEARTPDGAAAVPSADGGGVTTASEAMTTFKFCCPPTSTTRLDSLPFTSTETLWRPVFAGTGPGSGANPTLSSSISTSAPGAV